MTHILPWHSTLATDRAVYHDNTRCPEADAIALRDRRAGTGGRRPCEQCARYSREDRRDPPPVLPSLQPMPPSRGPAPRETHESRCPYCRSYRITRAGYIVVTGGMLKEAHRCEVCNTAFLLVHPAIG